MVKIAYVDDSPMQRDLVHEWFNMYLERTSHEVSFDVFESGEEVLKAATDCYGYDIYILDIVLPGMKGPQIAKAVTQIKDSSKIIFLTATVAFESRVSAFGYLVKPVKPEQLFELLDRALEEYNQ